MPTPPHPPSPAASLTDDLRRHLDLARVVLPKCPHADILTGRLSSLLRACERPPVVAVVDWRTKDAQISIEEDDAGASVAADVADTLSPDGSAHAPRMEQCTSTPGHIEPWWFADSVVVVASAAEERERRAAAQDAEATSSSPEDSPSSPANKTKRVTIDDVTLADTAMQHPPPRDANAPRGARPFWASQAFSHSPLAPDSLAAVARVARQLGPLPGGSSAFVIVEDCESRREAKDARACLVTAGLKEDNVRCVEGKLREGVDAGREDRCKIFSNAFGEWTRRWRADRAARVAPDYGPVRDCVRFWASFGTHAGGEEKADDAGAKALRHVASSANVESDAKNAEESEESNASKIGAAARVAQEALADAHARAALVSLGSFLRTAIEGLPRLGVAGAFDVAKAHRGSDRTTLSTSLYGSSAVEYAAGFFLSWTVPGPLAAHAAHFTARFRTAFVCALLAGESPLDPRVCAAAAAVCAGADGALALDATFAASERRFEVRRREERAAATTLGDSESQGSSSASLFAHTGSGRSALAGARMDAAVCESLVDSTADLRKRAMRAMRSVTDAGIDALRAAEGAAVDAGVRVREACAANASDVGPATSTSFDNFVSPLKPGDAETVAERAFARALAHETARRVAVVVCGPMWLGATQADFTSMAAGVMSAYTCSQSMNLFLPETSTRLEREEDAAARRALTASNGAVELTLEVDLDDDDVSDDVSDGERIPNVSSRSIVSPKDHNHRGLKVRVTLRPVPVAGGVMGEVHRLRVETKKGLDAAGRSLTTVAGAVGTATMDGVNAAGRGLAEVGKGIAGAGEWIGASVSSVAFNLSNTNPKPERDVAELNGSIEHEMAVETAGSAFAASPSNSAASFFAGIASPFASSSSPPANTTANTSQRQTTSAYDGPPVVKDVSSLTPAQVEAVITDPAVNAAIGRPSMVMKIMSDRRVMSSLRDPRVTKAYMEFTREPCMFVKYKDDTRVLALAQRVLELIAESGDQSLIDIMDAHDLFAPPPPDSMAMDPRLKSAEYTAVRAKYGGGSPSNDDGSSDGAEASSGWFKMPTVSMPVIPAMGLPSVVVKLPGFGANSAKSTEGEPAPAVAVGKKGLTNVAAGEVSEEDDSDSDEFLDAESD